MSSIVVLSTQLLCILLVVYIFIHRSLLSKFPNSALSMSKTNSGPQNSLFRLLQFINPYNPPKHTKVLNLKRRKETDNELCAICLCKVEEGDEIRELRCDHVFHTVCLERCVAGSYKHGTCPMCRGSLAPPEKWANELIGVFGEEQEIVFSKLFSCRSSRRGSTWWLI